MSNKAYAQRECDAMVDAHITNASSQEGIDFCTGKCPYSRCVLFEDNPRLTARESRVSNAKELLAKGHSVEQIANILRRSKSTIERYLE